MIGEGDPLRSFVEAEIRRGAMPGAAWWVGDAKGAIASGCAGSASVEPVLAPMKRGTPFDLASLTKPLVTALLSMILDRDGRLSLDASMGDVVDELRASPFAAATLRDAAAHRARLPAWVPLYAKGRTVESYLAAIASCEPPVAPGETLYSDLGYILLGVALERAAGSPLDRLFAERIARPLGLARCGYPAHSTFFDDAAATEAGSFYERELAGSEAHADSFRPHIRRGEVHDGNAWGLGGVAGHAGLFGTATEVASIALAILEPERLGLPAGALDAMMRKASAGTRARTVGFLTARDADSASGLLPDDAVGHSGFTGTSVWLDPARPRVHVLLTNRVHPRVPQAPFTATRRGFHALSAAL